MFKLTLGGLQNAGSSFGWGLVAVDFYLAPSREIAIVGPPSTHPWRAGRCPAGIRTP